MRQPSPTSTDERLLRVALWGPSGSGVSTILRALSALPAAEAGARFEARGEGDGAETAGLWLPPLDGARVRLEVFAAGSEGGPAARVSGDLADAELVCFVADLSSAGWAMNLPAWQALDRTLADVRSPARGQPILVLPNRADLREDGQGAEVIGGVLEAGAPRDFELLAPSNALTGEGLQGGLEALVVAAMAADRGAPPPASWRRRLQDLLGDRRPRSRKMPSTVPDDPWAQWLEVREVEMRALERERGLRRLLIDVGSICAAAGDVERVARAVLTQLVVNLDAERGWIGLPGPTGASVVVGTAGRDDALDAVRDFADRLREALLVGQTLRLGPDSTALLGRGERAPGLFLPFAVGGEKAWLLLLLPPAGEVTEDIEIILPPAMSFLGLAVARLRVQEALQELNGELEAKVAQRTAELQQERDLLEVRVRDRTRELEEAKRAALESERLLQDQRRRADVHQLAAGVAHELNNPLGAVDANLQFLREVLDDALAGSGLDAGDAQDLREAVTDALADMARARRLVGTLFDDAASSRRAAIRTSVGDAVQAGIRRFRNVTPGAPRTSLTGPADLAVATHPAEIVTWVERLLAALAEARPEAIMLRLAEADDGAHLVLEMPASLAPREIETLRTLAAEIEAGGGTLEADVRPAATLTRLHLPARSGPRAAAPRKEPAR